MKKIIALALTLVMLVAIAVPVFAEDVTQKYDGKNHVSQGVEVSYGVSDSYTLTLPSAIAFDGNAATATIKLDNVKIAANKTLQVTVASMTSGVQTQWDTAAADTKDAWDLIDVKGVSDPVEYWLTLTTAQETKPETGVVAQNGVVLTCAAAAADSNQAPTATETLCFNTAGTAQTGDFRDVLTFTVAYSA